MSRNSLSVDDAKTLLLLCGKDYDPVLNTFAETAPTTLGMIVKQCIPNLVAGKELEARLLMVWNVIQVAKAGGDITPLVNKPYIQPSHTREP